MGCRCKERPEYFDTFPDEEVYEVVSTLKEVDTYRHFNLLACDSCNQLYIAELQSRSPLFVKVKSRKDLAVFNEVEYRKLLILSSHGGLSENKCMQSNCNNKALKGMYLCVEHAFDWGCY